MNICTIVAHNYLAHARVLAQSFREHQPGAECVVLVIDEHDGHLGDDEPFTLVTPADLPFDDGEFADLATRYDVLELSTAVKPWLLRYMLERHDDGTGIAYFDPDIRIHSRMIELESMLERHPVVLTPHLTEPMPRDGKVPNEQALLVAGAFNLGFIGLTSSAQADALLDWWAERLRTDCVVAPAEGLFVDQRWIDFVPGLIPEAGILREPTYNIAYWNFATREFAHDETAGYTVNGAPLRFFHFSGYSTDRPGELSKHQNRIRLEDHPALRRICDEYGQALLAAGHEQMRTLPYELDVLPSGLRIDPLMRKLYRQARDTGSLGRSPADAEGEQEFLAWLQAPAPEAREISRYLYALWIERGDLQRAFPYVESSDVPAFQRWCWGDGREVIPEPLLPQRPEEEPPALATAPMQAPPPMPQRRFGVNVVGYLRAELGVAEVARQIIGGLDLAAVPVRPIALEVESSRQGHHYVAAEDLGAPFPVNVVCVNADMVPAFAQQAGSSFFEGKRTVGVWWWELDVFPDVFSDAFQHVDEVWVGSRFIADALSAISTVPVLAMPLPLQWPSVAPLQPGEHAWPDAFTFLYSFDYNSVFARKNPLAVIDAYRRAFDPTDGAALVIKSINHERHPELHALVADAASGRPDIQLRSEYLPAQDKDRLMASADCYVSLHRSEGFGLTMAEAMWHGTPVIATGYSGNVDFVDDESGWLVGYDLTEVGDGAGPYPAAARWADPDVEAAARAMRSAFEDPQEAQRRGAVGAARLRERHAPASAGKAMRERLEVLEKHTSSAPPRTEAGDWLVERAHQDRAGLDLRTHLPAAGSRFGRLGRLGRSAVRRAIVPYTWHQDRINRELADAIARTDERVAQALGSHEFKAAAREAQVIRELRSHESTASALREQVAAEQGTRERLAAELRSELNEIGFGLRRLQTRAFDTPVPERPWTHAYNALHRAFVTVALDDPSFQAWFREGADLPPRYGVGLDERVVEYPWLLAQGPSGRVLDAGSVLNHRHIIERFRPRFDALTIATLVTEDETFPELDVTYLDADLRALPFEDDVFDTTICVSTLEHVGMDNTYYGAGEDVAAVAADPTAEARSALAELLRVTRPGGKVLVTVPFGAAADMGWLRVLDASALDDLLRDIPQERRRTEFFRYTASGWQRSDAAAAARAEYRDFQADPSPVGDAAAAARAVACVVVTVS